MGENQSVSATKALVDFVLRSNYDDLPPEAIHSAKRLILDSIGISLVGSLIPKGKYVIDAMLEINGAPQCTVISSPMKTSVHNAVFANAELLSGLEYNAAFYNFGHIAPFLFPTLLGLGEYKGVSGKDFLLALALGFDVSARIGLSLYPLVYLKGDRNDIPRMEMVFPENYGYGWNSFGCVAGGGKLLNFNEDQMANAFSLAGYTSPVPFMLKYCSTPPASMVRYTAAGWVSQNAVISVLLAKKGYTADKEVLDGPLGYWKFCGSTRWDTTVLLDKIGEKWWIVFQTYKPWPICSLLNPHIEIVRKIIAEEKLRPEEIESLEFYGHPLPAHAPLWNVDSIEDEMGAQLHTKYGMAMAVFGIKPLDFQLSGLWRDKKIIDFMKKVNVFEHPKLKEVVYDQIGADLYPGIYRFPSEIVIKARGKDYRGYSEYAKGHDAIEDSRLSDEEIIEKFITNASHVLSMEKSRTIIDRVMNLERLKTIRELTQFLRP